LPAQPEIVTAAIAAAISTMPERNLEADKDDPMTCEGRL
jgi:hypothetical protein